MAQKSFPSLHLKVEQKDIICRQVFLAFIGDDYLMIAVHCFQFPNKTWNYFSEWGLLMNQSSPRHEVRRLFQQSLQAVC